MITEWLVLTEFSPQSTGKGLDSLTESVRSRRCESHTIPDVGHRIDDDRTEHRLKSCILGRPFDSRLVHGESTGSRDRMPLERCHPLVLYGGPSMEHSEPSCRDHRV